MPTLAVGDAAFAVSAVAGLVVAPVDAARRRPVVVAGYVARLAAVHVRPEGGLVAAISSHTKVHALGRVGTACAAVRPT